MTTPPFTISLWLVFLLSLSGCSSLSREKATGHDHVSVYYATTRQYDSAAPVDRAFTNAPTKNEYINFGTAEVSVPLPHSEGVQNGIKIERIDAPSGPGEGDFRAHTEAETGNPKRPLVVFVHGFNNSFETATERAALFAHDLQPDVSTKAAMV